MHRGLVRLGVQFSHLQQHLFPPLVLSAQWWPCPGVRGPVVHFDVDGPGGYLRQGHYLGGDFINAFITVTLEPSDSRLEEAGLLFATSQRY
jgi:hypothetical protein